MNRIGIFFPHSWKTSEGPEDIPNHLPFKIGNSLEQNKKKKSEAGVVHLEIGKISSYLLLCQHFYVTEGQLPNFPIKPQSENLAIIWMAFYLSCYNSFHLEDHVL